MVNKVHHINYNMTRDYCGDWTVQNALREIAQNAIDSKSEYFCKIIKNTAVVMTHHVNLPLSAFALGESKKQGEAIGGYGEGFKIAMLVLTRAGLNPSIAFAGYEAFGEFKVDELTGSELFHIRLEETGIADPGIRFKCSLDCVDIEKLKAEVTQFTSTPLPALTNTIHILKDMEYQGKIFVNGLYVTDGEGLTFGYNFSPNRIKLNRDRNMVDGVPWQLGTFFASKECNIPAQTIFELVEADAVDVSDISYFLRQNKQLQAEIARLFFNKYGEGATISKPGTTYIGGSSGVSCGYRASRAYSECGIKESKVIVDPCAPVEVLKSFLEKYSSKMRRDVKVDLKAIINKSKSWKK